LTVFLAMHSDWMHNFANVVLGGGTHIPQTIT